MPPKILRLSPEQEQSLLSVCVHEKAHALVAEALGMGGKAFVASLDSGIAVHACGPSDKVASVSIAGVLSEDLLGHRRSTRQLPTVFPVTADNLREWHRQAVVVQGYTPDPRLGFSAEDWRVLRWCRDFGPCKTAFSILEASRGLLMLEAKFLAEDSRQRVWENQTVPAALVEWEVQDFAKRAAEDLCLARQHEAQANADAEFERRSKLPPTFPADPGEFIWIIIAERNAANWSRAARLAAEWSEWLRMRGTHQDRLNDSFHSQCEWEGYINLFAQFCEGSPTDRNARGSIARKP